MLAGAVTLFVGLVQLKPGAEASQYRYVLIGSGLLSTLLGTMLAVIRCCLLPWVARRREQQRQNRRKQREPKAHDKTSPSKNTAPEKVEDPSPSQNNADNMGTGIGSSV